MVETRCWIIGQGIIYNASWVRELGSRRENGEFDANGWMYILIRWDLHVDFSTDTTKTQPYHFLIGHTEHQVFAQAYSLSRDARQDDWDLIRLLQTTPGSDSRWLGWQVIVGIEAHALLR